MVSTGVPKKHIQQWKIMRYVKRDTPHTKRQTQTQNNRAFSDFKSLNPGKSDYFWCFLLFWCPFIFDQLPLNKTGMDRHRETENLWQVNIMAGDPSIIQVCSHSSSHNFCIVRIYNNVTGPPGNWHHFIYLPTPIFTRIWRVLILGPALNACESLFNWEILKG